MQKREMDRLDLPAQKTWRSWGVLFSLLALVVSTGKALTDAPANTPLGVLVRWILVIMFSYLGVKVIIIMLAKKQTYLLASATPVFVTERTWFGILSRKKQETLKDAAWVRVANSSSQYSHNLCIEVGTHGYITTAIHIRNFAEAEIAECKALCTRVAEFLRIEDKGYLHYDHNGVRHTA